jgi:hypothetical protein
MGNGDVPAIVARKSVRLSEVTFFNILDSDHLQIVFYLRDRIKARNLSDPVGKFTDWEQFQCLASE